MHQGYLGQSASEFNLKWTKWQQECELRLDSGDFAKFQNLETICKVIITLVQFLFITWGHSVPYLMGVCRPKNTLLLKKLQNQLLYLFSQKFAENFSAKS